MSSSWRWIDLVDERPADAFAAAPARHAGSRAPARWLAAWDRRARPTPGALRIDARAIDPGGGAARVSLVRPPEGIALPFDDPAVAQARRDVLARSVPLAVVSTLLRDATRFMGSLLASRDGGRLDDPFARIFPALCLDVGPGLLGTMPAPAGPTIERYGSAEPWPWDRFPDDA
jgi:hypothetical protein